MGENIQDRAQLIRKFIDNPKNSFGLNFPTIIIPFIPFL